MNYTFIPFIKMIGVILYPVLWIMLLSWEESFDYVSIIIGLGSLYLFIIELRFNYRLLLKRWRETFRIKQYLYNFVFEAIFVIVSILLIEFSWGWLSKSTIILHALYGCLLLGMCLGNMEFRKDHISNARNFPWDLASLYEASLNPNIRKTYGTFIYIAFPLLLFSLFYDVAFLVILIPLQLDNIYSRLRMSIPIAVFLTTKYEDSLSDWLALKEASGEFAISSLVLDKYKKIPTHIAVQQDIVRVDNDTDWTSSVRTVMRYCKYIIMDTHSISPAVEEELKIVNNNPDFKDKIIFIKHRKMNKLILKKIHEIEKSSGCRCIFNIDEINQIIALERDSAMNGLPRNSLLRKLVSESL